MRAYQHLFQADRGRDCLARRRRRELCRLLWRQWSPNWRFDEATFERTAASFGNPDFVDVVIHAYRHAFGLAAGDPGYEEMEEQLARRPKITVPAVTLDGASDSLKPGGTAGQPFVTRDWLLPTASPSPGCPRYCSGRSSPGISKSSPPASAPALPGEAATSRNRPNSAAGRKQK